MAYLDTSVLGSYCCPEPLRSTVNQAIMSLDEAVISPLDVEFHSLLALKVRTREISLDAARRTMA